jgi:hypothetical protein
MTAALEGGEWSAARPGRTLPPGNARYPFYRRLGGPQGRSGRAENLVPTGIRSRTDKISYIDLKFNEIASFFLVIVIIASFKILKSQNSIIIVKA